MLAKSIYEFILIFLVFDFVLNVVLGYLNHSTWNKALPTEIQDLFDSTERQKAKKYAGANYKLSLFQSFFSFVVLISVLLWGGFGALDRAVSESIENPILRSLVFLGILGFASQILSLPFQLYSTFNIEQKFGFNKMTVRLFIQDRIKGLLLSAMIGGALLALLNLAYNNLGEYFWIVGWILVSSVSIFLAMFFTTLLLPIFNKLSPLTEGDLRRSIENYAQQVKFPLTNIFVMDGSKRSTKANAFFSGIGSKKNIVLFDNLIQDMNTDEVTAVLAHEVGHYKMKHVTIGVVLSLVQTGAMFYLFGWVAQFSDLHEVLGSDANSFHLSLLTFIFLYSPLTLVLRIFSSVLSRKHEFEADAYAKETNSAAHLISALKKLSKNHLSHLNPHPLYVFFNYSHPPLLQRIQKISK